MKILKILFILTFSIQLWSCRSDKKNNVESLLETPISLEPPIPAFHPYPFQFIKSEHLKFIYGDKLVNFNATLITNRVFKYNENDVQTFSVYAKTEAESDSFYFALPVELTNFWQEVTLIKSGEEFIVGYKDYEKKFIKMYRIFLGEYNLNRDNIYMRNIDNAK